MYTYKSLGRASLFLNWDGEYVIRCFINTWINTCKQKVFFIIKTLHSMASDLVLHYLPMSKNRDVVLIWVNVGEHRDYKLDSNYLIKISPWN